MSSSTTPGDGPDRISCDELLHIADPGELSVENVVRFYENLEVETRAGLFAPDEVTRIWDARVGIGILRESRARFAQAHAAPLSRAVARVFDGRPTPRVLDVCYGAASESLLFAGLGADVVAIDRHPVSASIAGKRTALYGRCDSRYRNIRVIDGDAVTFPYESLGQFDAVFSSIGIGAFVAPEALFATFAPCQEQGGLILLKNGNPAAVWNLLARRRLGFGSSKEYVDAAARWGYELVYRNGVSSVPRRFYRLGDWMVSVDRALGRFGPANLMVELAFERRSIVTPTVG